MERGVKMKLLINALVKFIFGAVLVGALIFIPAGSMDFFGGWLFMGLLFVPIFILGIILFVKSPEMLKKRLDSGEKEDAQKTVLALSALVFIAGFVLAGLDYRFGWTQVPPVLQATASVIFLASYILYAEVMRENAYLSRTIEVQEGQRVVDTGLYGIVRHPMYLATTLIFLMIPLILGSLIAFVLFLALPVLLAFRIKNEEKVLLEGLEGYAEYTKKVKYRLIPFVW